ncbi:flagellar hook-length control protein FliK, partial [Bordetella hinzii]
MSIGPPALGNVLVQRLDAVLGTTMAAHANLLTGARPDA